MIKKTLKAIGDSGDKKGTVAIVAGGKLSRRFLAELQKSEFVVGVDRGALWLLERDIVPDVAIGDFDSVTKRELATIKRQVERVLIYPVQKDATDLELAADYAIALKPKTIVIYGGLGSRLDHSVAALYLLDKLRIQGTTGVIKDENNEVMLVDSSVTIPVSSHLRYLSVFPLTPTAKVTLKGLAYELTQHMLRQGSTRGVSNEIVGDIAQITVHDGVILVIQSGDKRIR